MDAAGTDAVGALRWGFRRYRLLFLACVLLGAVLGPYAALQRATPIDAEAVVIAQRLDMDLIALPRYGEAVFNNGEVTRAVIAKFGELGNSRDVIPDRVSLVADQDSIVFRVIGHDTDPKTAADIANAATDTFIQALNTGGAGVGVFALQSPAEPPAAPGTRLRSVASLVAGLTAGFVLGIAVISVLLVIRRPVIAAEDAEDATGVPALGTVTVPRTRRGRVARPEEFSGLVPVCRRLLRLPTPIVVMVSRPREEGARRQISTAMRDVLMRVREVRVVGPSELPAMAAAQAAAPAGAGHPNGTHATALAQLTLVDSSEPLDMVQPPRSSATVLVVPEGIGSSALRAAVVEHLGGSAEARLLLFRRGRRSRGEPVSRVDPTEEPRSLEAAAASDTV